MVVCHAGAPCGQDGGRVTARLMAGSPYLDAIVSNARRVGRGSRLATYPVTQPGPSWRVDTAVSTPQPGPFADDTPTPKRLKTECEGCHVIKSLMEDVVFIEYLIMKGYPI